ncbi:MULTISPECIES: PilZ domain-containing protein [Thioalkalivibrio]|uniref:PilZ domain-containing protein n=1 Tax=Thioalkalivibrio TaxID=106633 RepID=UPI000376B87D|nr:MULTISPECIES: PilZ domain-containing protein [Thioalkalivibrio]
MTGERRRHPRIPMTVEVVAECRDGSQVRLTTNDISGGGAFLAWEDRGQSGISLLKELNPDDELMLQVFGLLGDGGEPPRVRARIVRVMEDGVAVQFDPSALGT